MTILRQATQPYYSNSKIESNQLSLKFLISIEETWNTHRENRPTNRTSVYMIVLYEGAFRVVVF